MHEEEAAQVIAEASLHGVPYVAELESKIVHYGGEEMTITGILNPPQVGTRVRATLGGTVLVGRIESHSKYALLQVIVEGGAKKYWAMLTVTLWLEAGWSVEILDTEGAK